MDSQKFNEIKNAIVKSISKVETHNDADVIMLKSIAIKLIIDVMQDEEIMNDTLIDLDRNKILKRRK